MITAEEVRELLDYDPETGVFKWKLSRGRSAKAGSVAGTPANGYINIMVMRRLYRAHRLAWLHVYGVWPEDQIDHINGIRSDNRISNLREATSSQNKWNARARNGLKGVAFHRREQKFSAQICKNYKIQFLGYFDTPEEAHAAYCTAAERLHGEFANGGVA